MVRNQGSSLQANSASLTISVRPWETGSKAAGSLSHGFGALDQILGPDRLVSSRSYWADVVRYESRLRHGFLRSRAHPFASEEPCHCDVLASATRDRCQLHRGNM
jgi:hypothetical protein